MIVPIKSIHDLRNEIVRLETLTVQQEAALKQRFSSAKTIYKTLLSALPKSVIKNSGNSLDVKGLLNQDVISTISRFLLPLTLNKTLFKGSGYITRTIVTFLSQKASGFINQNSVNSSWDKVKTIVSNVKIPETVATKVKPIENFLSKLPEKVKPLENLLSKINFSFKKKNTITALAKIEKPIVIKSID